MDGFATRAFSGPAGLHVLGLLSPALAKELRATDRSPVAEPFAQFSAARCRCGHLGAWPTRRQRPCPGVGAAQHATKPVSAARLDGTKIRPGELTKIDQSPGCSQNFKAIGLG